MAIAHELDRRGGLLRQVRGQQTPIARAELSPETSAHEVGDDADLALFQPEDVGQFIADAERALGGSPDGELIGLEVGDDAVSLHGAVGLYLGVEFAFNNDLGGGESLVEFVLGRSAPRRPADVAFLRHALGSAASTGGAVAATAAIGWPAKRTSGYREPSVSLFDWATPSTRSSTWIAFTPLIRSAALVSIDLIRAWVWLAVSMHP